MNKNKKCGLSEETRQPYCDNLPYQPNRGEHPFN